MTGERSVGGIIREVYQAHLSEQLVFPKNLYVISTRVAHRGINKIPELILFN